MAVFLGVTGCRHTFASRTLNARDGVANAIEAIDRNDANEPSGYICEDEKKKQALTPDVVKKLLDRYYVAVEGGTSGPIIFEGDLNVTMGQPIIRLADKEVSELNLVHYIDAGRHNHPERIGAYVVDGLVAAIAYRTAAKSGKSLATIRERALAEAIALRSLKDEFGSIGVTKTCSTSPLFECIDIGVYADHLEQRNSK